MTVDATHPNSEIEHRLEAIYALHNKKMDFRLDKGPYRDLLVALGNPQDHMPPVIHLAGTNGKGSTLAFLKSIFEAAGLKVHAYTSPHLITFNERITLAGRPIDDATLLRYLDMIETANAGAPVTFFEYTTALAFKAFADTPADICLLETGLGGRLDCTNVIETPLATIITSIGYDHMDWLGDTIEKIAEEKAGIMKSGVPCIIAPQTYGTQIRPVFEAKAAKLGCPLHYVERLADLPPLGLVGEHQKDNASTAITTINILHSLQKQGAFSLLQKIPAFAGKAEHFAAQALAKTTWPARMERVSVTPEIWFDCGHNADGALTIATQLKRWKQDNPNRPIHLILGLASDKDPNQFMQPLWPYIDKLSCVDLLNARNARTGEALQAALINPACPVVTAKKIQDCPIESGALTLVTGSLYLYEQLIISNFM